MKVMTFNANGIRSAQTKGFWPWFMTQDVDVLCVQELKAQEADLVNSLEKVEGYEAYFHCAQKRGYSGCGIWTRRQPDQVIIGLGDPFFDAEGRYVELRFDNLSVLSVYYPSGTSGDERQAAKYRFLDLMRAHLDGLRTSGRDVIMCGDVNIAHQNIDIKNWKGNLKNSGFLPEERQWVTDLLASGYVDMFRVLDPRPEQYTWWSQRGQARAKNVGWRIDYHFVTPSIAALGRDPSIYTQEKFSDHAPLTITYDIL